MYCKSVSCNTCSLFIRTDTTWHIMIVQQYNRQLERIIPVPPHPSSTPARLHNILPTCPYPAFRADAPYTQSHPHIEISVYRVTKTGADRQVLSRCTPRPIDPLLSRLSEGSGRLDGLRMSPGEHYRWECGRTRQICRDEPGLVQRDRDCLAVMWGRNWRTVRNG